MNELPTGTPQRPYRRWRKLLRMLLLFLVTPYLVVVVIMVVFQRDLIYVPRKSSRLWAREVTTENIVVEDVALKTSAGLTLQGWHFRTHEHSDLPGFLVLYFPGNAGNRHGRLRDCQDFTQLGCEVLLFDYRGYGENPGEPTESALADDAQQIWKYSTETLGTDPQRILLFGESLGGAVAVRLAEETSLAGRPPAALVLNSTFASLPRTVAWHYPSFPFQYLVWDRYPSIDRMPAVACPILQFHCTDDEIVPINHARDLFHAAPTVSASGIEPRFVEISGGHHNFISASEMRTELKNLLDKLH